MIQLTKFVDRVLAIFTMMIFTVLVVCVVWQVISRYVLQAPSTMTDETARFLFMWLGLMGAAYTLGQKRHLAIDLLTMNLRGKSKAVSELVILVAVMLFCSLVMVYGGGGLVHKTLSTGQISPSLGVHMGLIYIAIPLSGGLMLFYSLCFAIEKIKVLLD